ncbi:TIGR03557 family F420-dependent LLM class oxidoreductase [Marmoricola sp. RAF53]|uniref:TIGR03557 family F420-dependent LLM class oxidoreductase n=1 Tax=Marmoricola sp. RAF53 TaxID=3233059 RepID=UPI003F9A41A3
MTRIGYTLMGEQSGPADLVRYAERAEEAGFDFEVISDHYFPWLESQGHSPYAWSVLGAVSAVTRRVELMTYVTCPTRRYHPAVVAQKAATVSLLSNGRFTLGLGAGENLNEHVVGPWPAVNVRHEMLTEALVIIAELLNGGYVNFPGKHFAVDSARLWDLPDRPVPIAVAVSGETGIERFADLADDLIAVEPDAELVSVWDGFRGKRHSRKIGQVPVCWAPSRDEAIRIAHEQFRWFGSGWKVNAELPGPAAFEGASRFVRPEDVADAIPCGPDLDGIVAAVRAYVDAGFTDVALVQVGNGYQDDFLDVASKELIAKLRADLRPANGPA